MNFPKNCWYVVKDNDKRENHEGVFSGECDKNKLGMQMNIDKEVSML